MKNCVLCPRRCGVDRMAGQRGICGQSAEIKVARAALHMWEEPCISGENGSGAVFFSGCSLHCVFCQNHNIANGDVGNRISVERLGQIFLELQEQGANNINLVTGTQFVPQIVSALQWAKENGLTVPIVYNTSAYEEVENLKLLEGYVDIYLPDLKYVDKELSRKYSHAEDYFEKAKAAIAEMVRQTGNMCFTEEPKAVMREILSDGKLGEAKQEKGIGIEEYQRRSEAGESLIMTKGVIVRHLLLPGCTEDSKRVLKYLLEEYGSQIFISIMNQYTPLPHVEGWSELNRKVSECEYEAVIDYAIAHGIENGFIQEGETAQESFIPDFNGEGVRVGKIFNADEYSMQRNR